MASFNSAVAEIKVYAQILEAPATSKRVTNVFHYAVVAPGTSLPDPQALCTAFVTNVVQSFVPLLHSDYSVIETGCRYVDTTTNAEVINTATLTGGKTGPRLPSYAAVNFELKSIFRGRSYRSSKHFSPLTEADTNADVLVAAAATAWKNIGAVMLQSIIIGGQTLVPCVLSRKYSQLAKDPTTISAAQLTNYVLNSTLGTLKRRKPKTAIA